MQGRSKLFTIRNLDFHLDRQDSVLRPADSLTLLFSLQINIIWYSRIFICQVSEALIHKFERYHIPLITAQPDAKPEGSVGEMGMFNGDT